MPFKIETLKVKLPKEHDRRIKLSEEDKLRLKHLYKTGEFSIRGLARLFKVSKRLVQLTLFPERLEHQKALYKERRKDGRYYNKEAHRKAMKKTRDHRKQFCFIPKESLTPFCWYKGEGRSSNVGFWDGSFFHTYCRFYNTARSKFESHWNDKDGTFKPKQKISIDISPNMIHNHLIKS